MGLAHFRRLLYRHWTRDRPTSWLGLIRLSWRYDCYVSGRALVYHPHLIRLAPGVRIAERAMLNYRSGGGTRDCNIEIGAGSAIMPDAKLIPQKGWIKIGQNCSIQYGCLLYGVGGLEIGDNTRIAAHTIITPMNHVFSDTATPIWQQGETARGIRIGHDVWIGNGVSVLDGVTIGDGCVIGAGSVVTKSLPPYAVAVGSPARVLKHRGEEDTAILRIIGDIRSR